MYLLNVFTTTAISFGFCLNAKNVCNMSPINSGGISQLNIWFNFSSLRLDRKAILSSISRSRHAARKSSILRIGPLVAVLLRPPPTASWPHGLVVSARVAWLLAAPAVTWLLLPPVAPAAGCVSSVALMDNFLLDREIEFQMLDLLLLPGLLSFFSEK